ncbi:ABC transporter permease [Arthrobacter sp. zg-Y1219]|uniref:ABC transporter permease n=1 Tax=Arthrobacter sp. zg-Y1219 TaxID=3049067 RepID=UPI0024C2CDBA|nr:ABC transporter permease [Arthrobacter sp. zg-Y1219]MDK1361703.1 ABC transporter permease [Arthrobacter sp. zg-Y1219]
MKVTSPIGQVEASATHVPELKTQRRELRRSTGLTLSIASPVVLLLLWELCSRSGVVDARFFPPPSGVLLALVQGLGGAELWGHIGISLSRIVIGFLIGGIPAVLLGLAMGLSPVVRAILQPLVNATFPIPKLAILPLFILIFGLGEASKYMVLAVAVFFIVLVNTAAGVRAIDRTQLEVGSSFGAGTRMMFFDIALPGALPFILSGLKLGMNVALLVIVAVEFTGASSGIGYLIWNSWQVFKVEQMYVGLVVTALFGFGFAGLFALLERLLMPWKRH